MEPIIYQQLEALSKQMPGSIFDTIYKLKQNNYLFVKNKCPNEVTMEMLKKELMCGDVEANEQVTKDGLWSSFYTIHFVCNKYGFHKLNGSDMISSFDFLDNSAMSSVKFRDTVEPIMARQSSV
jgi:hypothetical protein